MSFVVEGRSHHFVGFDGGGEKEPGDKEKQVHEQKENAHGGQSLQSETVYSRSDSFGKFDRSSSESNPMSELVQEKGERQNADERQ